jgi:hypothetical protein
MNSFQFGQQTITTQVQIMVPRALTARTTHIDVAAAMDEQPRSRAVSLKMVSAPDVSPGGTPGDEDPFAEVEV